MDYTSRSSQYSATTMVSLLRSVLAVDSVLDVGCARGTWLKAWRQAGTADVFGVDGDYIKPEQLAIPLDRFEPKDLSRPFDLKRTFALVQTLEVAEHIAAEHADTFVQNLVRHAEGLIFFSAAPPGQGGEFHVNEQPYEYWREKLHRHGYAAYDFVRPRLAHDKGVSFWYRFNPIIYATAERARVFPDSVAATRLPDRVPIRDVSPVWFKARKAVVRSLPFGAQQGLARLKARMFSR